ncbi:MAG: aminotransferase class I/II-fold pyridoxal phosphate-dependent enzyme [Nitrososphaerota archaeon]|jgi:LL-diaminopimelate aminotransferase|nr:aminotransferase class I/II-fold pyridoxal phosphate-dependent enzyme [Nitrososphaerota archaeon]
MTQEYSRNLQRIPPYPFVKMEQLARERRRKGLKVLSFSIGDPDLRTPDFILDAMSEAARDPAYSGYSSSDGEPWFKEAVASWYKKRFGVDLDPGSEVCALIGSKEGLANISRGFVNEGDIVVCPDPGYPVYANGSAILIGGLAKSLRLNEENGFRPNADRSLFRGAKVVFANYPNNPTGAVISINDLSRLAEDVTGEGAIFCYDNAYSEITFGDYVAPSVLQTRSDREGLVEFHSCSKTFSMTGLRIGFAVGDRRVIDGLKKVKSQVDSGPPKFIQHAAKAALESYTGSARPSVVQSFVNVYRDRLERLARGLDMLGFKVKPPSGTFYLWQKVDGTSEEFAQRLANRGVLVTPGTAFGQGGEGYVRWSLTQSTELIDEALKLIGSTA